MSFHSRPLDEEPKQPSRFLKVCRTVPWKKIGSTGILLTKPLFAIGKRIAEKRRQEERVKRILAMSAAVIVAIFMILLTLAMLFRLGGLSLGSFATVAGAPLGKSDDGITNVLLLGQGDLEHDGIDLTDTVIVASIGTEKEPSVSLLSLPRDLYFLHTDSMETDTGKLNALWRDNRILLSKKGMEFREASLTSMKQLAKEIGDALGIEMHHSVKVDFTAFEKVVDALGGIDIVVPAEIHDTEYPGPNYTYQTFHIDAGEQHLDGATALKYARTRSTTSDFDRSKRQQQILRAAAEKAQSAGLLRSPKRIRELYSILADHLLTDLSLRQLMTMANIGKKLSPERMVSMQLSDINGLYEEPLIAGGLLYAPPRNLFEGAAVFLPVSIPEFPVTWKQVRAFSDLFFRHRDLYLSNPRVAVLNGGAPEGSAGRLSREFIKYGFDVVEVANAPGDDRPSSFIVSHTDAGAFFASLLSFAESEEEVSGREEANITVVLGEDYQFKRFQDLIKLPVN